ncbi:MAG TPA: hypothetical protein QF761_04715, partial [Pirellulales bacterium]|nr:hypothetical protein [Pirellulales bacterium]
MSCHAEHRKSFDPLRRLFPCLQGVFCAVAFGSLHLLFSTSALAVEEPVRFLEKLRAVGYLDTAGDYLEYLQKSDLVDDEFKKTIPYEKAVLLVAKASRVGDRGQTLVLLKEAIEQFKNFATSQPDSPRAIDVRFQITNVYMALAKASLARSQQPGIVKADAQKEARDYYQKALQEVVETEKVVQSSRKKVRTDLSAARKAAGRGSGSQSSTTKLTPKEKQLIEQRDKLRTDWMNSELKQAEIIRLTATTYPEGSGERKGELGKAASAYEELFLKHDGRVIGLYCRLQQGRCLTEMGRYDEAIDALAELIDLGQSEDSRLQTFGLKAVRYSIECYIAKKDYKNATNMAKIELDENPQGAVVDGIRFFYAKAKVEHAATLTPDKKGEKDKLLKQASKIYKGLTKSKTTAEWKVKATEELLAMGAIKVQEEKPQGEPTNFDEAFSAAAAVMRQRSILGKAIAKTEGEEKKKLEEDLTAANEKAFEYYRLALSMADKTSLPAKVKSIQGGLCFLFFQRGDNLRAAVIGEYLGRSYPNSKEDKFGTNVALNAWLREYGEAGEARDFEKMRIERLAKRLNKRWPGSKEATAANDYLLTFAIQDGDAEQAIQYLDKVPIESTRRGGAQISVGQLLFNRYVRDKNLSDEARPDAELLNAARKRAAGFLADGLKAYDQDLQVDRAALAGAYALSQVSINQNKPLKTIEYLENQKYGPLTLVDTDHPLIANTDYPLKTYRLALRAYIAALPDFQSDPKKQNELVQKAFGIIDKMEKAVGTDADAENRLTKIYVDLGKDLESQIKELGDEGNSAGKAALSGAFEKFLQQIKKRPQATTYKTMIWIAETYFTLGKSNSADAEKADQYFGEAGDVYRRILKRKLYKNPRQEITIQMRLAACLRGQEKYKDAIKQLVEILDRKAGNLGAQVQAAETLYDAGSLECDNYVKSFLGDEKNEETDRNIIWGWKKIAQQTASKVELEKYFYTAKLYGVRARRKYAECILEQSPKRANRLFAAAEGNLLQIYGEYPNLGGPDFVPE